jgi:multiple sugar transport system substrate-binding protein
MPKLVFPYWNNNLLFSRILGGKIMKKLYYAMFFLVVISLLTDCGSPTTPKPAASEPAAEQPAATEPAQEAPAEKIHLVFVFWALTPTAEKGWEETFAKFNEENPDIEVELIGAQGASWGEYLDKVATMVAGGQQLDVISVATEGMRQLATRGLIRPIDDLMEKNKAEMQEFVDDVAPDLMDSTKVDGKLYGLPFSWNNMVMWYSPSRVKAAGLDLPKSDWTKDDFVNYAKKLTGENTYGYATEIAYFSGTMPWQFANGTTLFNEDFSKPIATDPKNVETMQFLTDLIRTEKVAPDPAGVNGTAMLQSGQVSLFGAGRWPIMSFAKDPSFTDFDVQLWPKWTTQVTEIGVDSFPIFTSCKNVDAAWKMVVYMNRADVQATMLGTVNKSSSNLPARRSIATSPEGNFMPNYKLFYDSLDNAQLVPAPPNFTQIENIWVRYVGQIYAGEVSVIDGLTQAQAELEAALTAK